MSMLHAEKLACNIEKKTRVRPGDEVNKHVELLAYHLEGLSLAPLHFALLSVQIETLYSQQLLVTLYVMVVIE